MYTCTHMIFKLERDTYRTKINKHGDVGAPIEPTDAKRVFQLFHIEMLTFWSTILHKRFSI